MFPAIILVLMAIGFRVIGPLLHIHHSWSSNFSPLASIVLCGALFFPKKIAVIVPMAILLLSDFVLNTFVYSASLFSWDILSRYLAFALIGIVAYRRRAIIDKTLSRLAGAAVASSTVFFLFTNTVSWLSEPGYAKTPAGLLQALTVGLPGYPPTWVFFRNSLVGDLIFTALFLVCMAVGAKKSNSIPQERAQTV